MITEPDTAETLAAVLEATAELLRAMSHDPTIPDHARTALHHRFAEIDTVLRMVEAIPK